MKQPIWQPCERQVANTNLRAYQDFLRDSLNLEFSHYQALHSWSVQHRDAFWSSIWDFCEVIGDKGQRILIDDEEMRNASFYPDAKLNFAENLLRRRDLNDALVFWPEGRHKLHRRLCWRQLYDEVSRLQQAFKAMGLKPGERVAAYMANTLETVIAMLACASLGAIWCSCSPDFGGQSVLNRFQQLSPKLLIAHEGYCYAGKHYNNTNNINILSNKIKSIDQIIIIPYGHRSENTETDQKLPSPHLLWDEVLAPYPPKTLELTRFPFNHPLYVLFSSGTTGKPKCIVHSAGGTLLQHLKEHQLHCDIKPDHRMLYYTTTSWMMWHWMVSALASKAALILYDGSPHHPSDAALFDCIDAEGVTFFGTSAKFIATLSKHQYNPMQTHNLGTLRLIASTGSTLNPEHFDFVYQHIKRDVQLSSISGGTDIISCFVLGNPLLPIYRGEITCAGLGMAVEIWNEAGQQVQQQKGELVCSKAFPSMPIGFWNDDSGNKYHAAYFNRFPQVWTHGDFAQTTPQNGFIIHGRSDATLNPGGVRIGSAEIYQQVELIPEVTDSLVVEQTDKHNTRVILFVQLRAGSQLDNNLSERIKNQIRSGTTPRHVPNLILQVPGVPRTHSGKIAELAVKHTIEGQQVKNLAALVNPDVLQSYKQAVETALHR